MRSPLTALDLFSGCGGLTVGLKRARFKVLAAVEIDEAAAAAYALNHRKVRLYRADIRDLDPLEVAASVGRGPGEIDLIAGCPPCQGFSTLRTMNGSRKVDDPRNALINEFLRFVEVLRPRAVMLENVPALARENLFSDFCTSLVAMGYSLDWSVLNVADYGVPQRRRRVIVLASRVAHAVLAEGAKERRTVRAAIGALRPAGLSGDPVHDMPERRSEKVRELIASIPRDGGSRTDLPKEKQLPCHQRTDGFKDVYGRMRWDAVAPTITSGCFNPSKGRFLHPSEDRCITLREAALLQTFPARYRFPLSVGKQKIALLIGNALPPEFVYRHALTLRAQLLRSSS